MHGPRCTLLLCAAASVPAQQIVWTSGAPVLLAGTPNLCFDEHRERAVLVIEDQTWEFDGSVWTRAASAHAPGNRGFPALAYDPGRGVAWLFGGYLYSLGGSAPQNDLWTWDGAAWVAVPAPAAPRPAARYETALAFDTARNRLVLYGGRTLTGLAGDTWEFDGAAWLQATPTASPTARYGHDLAYDRARAVTVLFGGLDASLTNALDETWEWDGTNWIQRQPTQSPSPRYAAGLAYDPIGSRVLLHSGRNGQNYPNDTWSYDGATWSPVPTGGTAPPIEVPARLCFDPARNELLTVRSRAGGMQTWANDGATWRSVLQEPQPGQRKHHSCAYDPVRGVGVMFGAGLAGYGYSWYHDTYEYRGGVWRNVSTAVLPPARESAALAHDPVNGAMLLFGGGGFAGNDVWLFDGSAWTARQPAASPSPRSRHAMATDTARSRIVLFGGASGTTMLGDTWEWDGTTWQLRQSAAAPTPRASTGLVFDPLRQRTVLYGGGNYPVGPPGADHWEWDGSVWTQRSPSAPPGARMAPGIVFDEQRGAVLLHGGYYTVISLPIPRNDLWQWDGVVWTSLTLASPPPARLDLPLFYDAGLARSVLYSGDLLADEWLLGPVSTAAAASYGAGCRGTFGTPHLRARGLPVQGNRWFGFSLSSMATGAFTVLGIGTQPQNAPIGGGCTLLVDSPVLLWGLASGRGHLEYDVPIPDTSAVRGVVLFAQAAGLDAGGAFGGLLATSAGLRVEIDR